MKEKARNLMLRITLRWLRHKTIHLIDTSDGLRYFSEGRVIGGRLTPEGISLFWTSVGTGSPDYRYFPRKSLYRHRVLGLVIDKAYCYGPCSSSVVVD